MREQRRERGAALPAEASPERPALGAKHAGAMALLSVAGMGVSAYLTYTKYASGDYFCAGLGNCDYVNTSEYAELAGVPVSILGFLVYAGIFALALLGGRSGSAFALNVAPLGIFGLALAGVLFSAYLSYVELFILYAI